MGAENHSKKHGRNRKAIRVGNTKFITTMKTKLLLLPLLVFIMVSCSTQEKIAKKTTTKTMDVAGAGIVQNPVIVDLQVSETKTVGVFRAGIDSIFEIDAIKQAAVAEALKSANADVLVEPKFEIASTETYVMVTVTGFPAVYKNFRNIKPEEYPLLKTSEIQKAVVYDPQVVLPKKKK